MKFKIKVIIIRATFFALWTGLLIYAICDFKSMATSAYAGVLLGFMSYYFFIPLFLTAWLFSVIKSLVLIANLIKAKNISNDTKYFAWKKSLPKVSKIIIITVLIVALTAVIINTSMIRLETTDDNANLGVNSFTSYELKDGIANKIKHGKAEFYNKQYYNTPNGDSIWFRYTMLIDAPEIMVEMQYASNDEYQREGLPVHILEDYKGIDEVKYCLDDGYFKCILRDGNSMAYVGVVFDPEEIDISFKENPVDILVDTFLAERQKTEL